MSNVVVLLCACAVLAIGASAQQCGNLVQTPYVQSGGYGLGNEGLGQASGLCGNPYVQSGGYGLGNEGLGQASGLCGLSSGGINGGFLGNAGYGYGSQGVEALSIATGSSYAPNGFDVLADNLEIAGPVAVSGAYPILGTVSIGGNLPTGGQGQVSYSTASGIGLSSGGCGYGLPSAQPSTAGLSGNNYGLSGASGINGLFGVSQLGLSNTGCGCRNNYF